MLSKLLFHVPFFPLYSYFKFILQTYKFLLNNVHLLYNNINLYVIRFVLLTSKPALNRTFYSCITIFIIKISQQNMFSCSNYSGNCLTNRSGTNNYNNLFVDQDLFLFPYRFLKMSRITISLYYCLRKSIVNFFNIIYS
ncbi:hypothetical protein D3C85_517590 [compost metagenome]